MSDDRKDLLNRQREHDVELEKGCRSLWHTLVTLTLTLLVTLSVGHAKERVVVLGLKNKAGVEPAEVGYLSDVLREVASELPTRRFSVMKDGNIALLLPPGKDLEDYCEEKGSCAVQIAREIGAHWAMDGTVVRFGRSLRVMLNLYHTESGELRGSKGVKGKTVEALESPLKRAAGDLFSKLTSNTQRVSPSAPRESFAERMARLKRQGQEGGAQMTRQTISQRLRSCVV